ncbi:MAG: DUF615 domain-containing protein, partial [Myxococcales bacterium]|nr:DUF615 domain-containing protein [Myxococcales bacterium]
RLAHPIAPRATAMAASPPPVAEGSPAWWCAELLRGGDEALGRYLEEHPQAERQRLRQALRAASSEKSDAKAAQHRKVLLRILESSR